MNKGTRYTDEFKQDAVAQPNCVGYWCVIFSAPKSMS